MSSSNNAGVVLPPTLAGVLGLQNRRLTGLDQSDGTSHWIYVCVDNTDPNYTLESPLFENGWMNAGPPDAPVSFKRFLGWIHMRGGVTNASITPSVMFHFTTSADGVTPNTGQPLMAFWPFYRQQLLVPLGDGSGSASVLVMGPNDTDPGSVSYVNQGPF